MKRAEVAREIYALWQSSGWSEEEFLCESRLVVRRGTKRLKVCYHGTDEAAAKSILQEGFKPGTYFGEHLEDALSFGGPYIFEVCFPQDTTSQSGWQFTTRDRVPPDRIVQCKRIEIAKVLHEDEALQERIFKSNLPDKEDDD